MADPEQKPDTQVASLSGCFCQVVWSILGPGFVLIAGSLCVLDHRPIGAPQDWFLLGAVIVAIVARYRDPTDFSKVATGDAPPPSPRKYAAWIAGAGVLAFVIAHFVAPHVF